MGQYPRTEYFLFEVLYTTFFYPTRRRAYRVVALTAMVHLATQIYLSPEVTDSARLRYAMGFMVASRLMFIAYILLAEGPFPDSWRRLRDEVHEGTDASSSDKAPSNFPLTKKLWWMVDIAWGTRMIGWVQEPHGMPPHPSPSRRTFLWKTSSKFIKNVIIADLATSVLALSPAFDNRVHDPTDGPETYLAAVPLLHRVPYVLSWIVEMATTASATQNIIALVCVGLGYSSPTLWPDAWGSWRDAYTVRKLWGRTWHQRPRPVFAGLGKLVANKILNFPRSSNRSSYTQLYVAFFLSAILHSSADFMLAKRMAYYSFKFFLLQAVAITFEDLVIHIAKRLLRRGGIELDPGKANESLIGAAVRVIGYSWVILWLCLTLPVLLDESNSLGFCSTDRKPITRFLLNRWNRWA